MRVTIVQRRLPPRDDRYRQVRDNLWTLVDRIAANHFD